jgi:hypothetical protein
MQIAMGIARAAKEIWIHWFVRLLTSFPAEIVADVHGHLHQPGFKWPAPIEPMKVTKCAKKNFLRGILCIFLFSEKPPRDRQNAAFVPQKDLFEGGDIACNRAFEDGCEFGLSFRPGT